MRIERETVMSSLFEDTTTVFAVNWWGKKRPLFRYKKRVCVLFIKDNPLDRDVIVNVGPVIPIDLQLYDKLKILKKK